MTRSDSKSPDYLRTSLAAAMTLGLRSGSFYRDARLGCLNLLLTYPDGCRANCSYCGLRRERETSQDAGQSFIRVEWPAYPLDVILETARTKRNLLRRVCVSMIMHPAALEDTCHLVERLTGSIGLPVSVLANPSTMEEGSMELILGAGADMVSVAVDAATKELFARHRGKDVTGPHKWDNYWKSLSEAAIVFGGEKVGCHLIAGLGETEREMMETVQRVRDLGARTHLFSFYPEEGSLLESMPPCPLPHFRRVQLGRFLIDYDISRYERMEFDDRERITGFGPDAAALEKIVWSGRPFMTSGCPGNLPECDCNRPYGDGPPSDIRSYPFVPDRADLQSVRKELATYVEAPQTAINKA